MNRETVIKVIKRRINHLNKRIEAESGSESALMFDLREREALEFAVNELAPPPMAEEVQEIIEAVNEN